MTHNERNDYVNQRWLECIKPITNVRKGTGCEVGKTYWFECVYCTDGSHFFRKLSDNNHYDEVYITDEELVENFVKLGKYNALYSIQSEIKNKKNDTTK